MPDESATGLFDGLQSRGPAAAAVSDAAWISAMLEVEVALARAEAEAGVISADDADAIERAGRRATFDAVVLGTAAMRTGNPAAPLVEALRSAVGWGAQGGSAAGSVHLGATSQDVVDSAGMLVAGRAIDALLADLDAAADACSALANRHRATLIAGRTLLQQAVPTTFGLKAAAWLTGLDAAGDGLRRVRGERLALQLGGAAGTLAALGSDGPRVAARMAELLGLGEPVLAWHTERTRIADLAGALGTAAAAIAKPALDVVLLSQTEIAEVHDSLTGRGGSSTVPAKHNPVAVVLARACAAQAPGLVAMLMAAAGAGEHERAAGAWHAEWRPLVELLRAVGSAAAWLRDALEHLEVDADRMRATVDSAGGVLLAERVVAALVPGLGRETALAEVEAAATAAAATAAAATAAAAAAAGVPGTRPRFADALVDRPLVRAILDQRAIEALLEPAAYLGAADELVGRAIAAHEARVRTRTRARASAGSPTSAGSDAP